MVTISISADALAAITTTLPDGLWAQARPDGKGGYLDIVCHAGRVSIPLPSALAASESTLLERSKVEGRRNQPAGKHLSVSRRNRALAQGALD
jgi:hypothetical protein